MDDVYRIETGADRGLTSWVRADIGLMVGSIVVLAVCGYTLARVDATTPGRIEPGRTETQTGPGTYSLASVGGRAAMPIGPVTDGVFRDNFDNRFRVSEQSDSFDDRFASAFPSSGATTGRGVTRATKLDDDAPPQQLADLGEPAAAHPEVPRVLTPLPPTRPTGAFGERLVAAASSLGLSLPPDADRRTAIYDIAARTVYLPNGAKLEAHSGLGNRLDDPRYINAKDRGPTPPNIYHLTLREELFHGVRALRLTPVDEGKMFGRDGILAHTYMLGPNGQSNGCVSFRNYEAFLNAFLKGEVDRLVVVDHIPVTTVARATTASGG